VPSAYEAQSSQKTIMSIDRRGDCEQCGFHAVGRYERCPECGEPTAPGATVLVREVDEIALEVALELQRRVDALRSSWKADYKGMCADNWQDAKESQFRVRHGEQRQARLQLQDEVNAAMRGDHARLDRSNKGQMLALVRYLEGPVRDLVLDIAALERVDVSQLPGRAERLAEREVFLSTVRQVVGFARDLIAKAAPRSHFRSSLTIFQSDAVTRSGRESLKRCLRKLAPATW
jgi:hypothetical protein